MDTIKSYLVGIFGNVLLGKKTLTEIFTITLLNLSLCQFQKYNRQFSNDEDVNIFL